MTVSACPHLASLLCATGTRPATSRSSRDPDPHRALRPQATDDTFIHEAQEPGTREQARVDGTAP